jgi:predicted ATPase/DNA-binding SARP family transcriptional activator
MPRLSISLIGTFQVTLGGEYVTRFESDKVRALLAYLAVESERRHRREKLAGLLWPAKSESKARRNLSQALFNLRSAIGDRNASPAFLHVGPQTIQFNPASDHWLDVSILRKLMSDCTKHSHRSLSTCDECIGKLQKALGLYRGGFLAGFSLKDSPAFEEWSLLEGESLHRAVTKSTRRLVDGYRSRGEYEPALTYARRRVELEPWHEDAHRQLMELLLLNGQRPAALAQYEVCRDILKQELGVEPEPQTQALYQRIRAHRHARDTHSDPLHDLPIFLTPFVGRGKELAGIKAHLTDPSCRLLSVVGPGGIGKTRLALEAVASWQGDPAVYFIPLATAPSPDALVPTIAETIGFSFRQTGNPRDQLVDYLRSKHILFILDNFEHLLDGAPLVDHLLRSVPYLSIMITSRFALGMPGEHLLPLGGLRLPQEHTLEHALENEAIQLFSQAARHVQPDFQLTSDNLSAVIDICHQVAGMPLGILLAASWIRMLTPAEIAVEIRQDLDFLAMGSSDLPSRQHSLRAVFDQSWRLLAPREREISRALAVFRGGFTRDAAEQVAGASLRDLAGLVAKSLLHRRPTGRYEIHEMLRQYAAEKLDQSPEERRQIRERHCDYYLLAVEHWEKELKGPDHDRAMLEMEAERENAHTAWDWAATQGKARRLAGALDGLCLFYTWRGRHVEGETACQLAAENLGQSQAAADQCLLARILTWQSVFTRRLGPTEPAARLLEEGSRLLERATQAGWDTRSEQAAILLRTGRLKLNSDRKAARELFQRSLDLYQALTDLWGMMAAVGSLGALAWNLGDYAEAQRRHQERLAIAGTLGTPHEIAGALMALGRTALIRGRLEQGERLIQEASAILDELGDRAGIADGLRNRSLALQTLGRFEEAYELMQQGLKLYEELGFRYGLENAMLGSIHIHLGQYKSARSLAQRGLAISSETHYQRGTGFSLLVMAEAALARKRYDEAWPLLQQSLLIYQRLEQRERVSRVLADLGLAACGLSRLEEAQGYVRQALEMAAEIGAFVPLISTLPVMALLMADGSAADQASAERGVELCALAGRHPYIANSCWFQAISHEVLTAVSARMAPDRLAAAQRRGHALDLPGTVQEVLRTLKR